MVCLLTNAERHTLQFGSREERIALAARVSIETYETEIREQLAEGLGLMPDDLDAKVEKNRMLDNNLRELEARLGRKAPQAREEFHVERVNGHADARPFSPLDAYVDEPRARANGSQPSSVAPPPEERARIAAPIWFKDANPNLARRDAVGELLGSGTLSSIYGGSGSGKTFLALDLALAIARGEKWCEKHVLRGIVLYAAGEGHQSVLQRLAAYRLHHFAGERRALPFATIPQSINLLDPAEHVEAVVALANQAQSEWELPTVLIVIDTLARSIAGHNENAPEVMGAAIKSADRLRELTKAHVLLVHHTGKNDNNGARGHSSLRAALDTEIEVTGNDGVRTAKVTKQRDLPIGATFAFSLKPVVLGVNPETGAEVTSCIVEHVDTPAQSARRTPVSKNQAALLAGLKEFVRGKPGTIITPAELVDIAKGQGVKDRRRLAEAREGLYKQGWIVDSVGGIQIAGDAL